MPLPYVSVNAIDAPPTIGANLDDRQLFIGVEDFRGSLEPQLFTSGRQLSQSVERTAEGIFAYDCIDVALREGVGRVYKVRIVGPAALAASIALAGSTGTSGTLKVTEVGEWANGATGGLKAAVATSGGNTTITIYRGGTGSGSIVETSPLLGTRAAIQAWAQNISTYLSDFTLGADTTMPVTSAAANFIGGTSDSGSITQTQIAAALARCTADYGPGQVVLPGRTTLDSNTTLLQHAKDFRRTALCQIEAGLAKSDMQTQLASLRALGTGAEGLPRLGGIWGQDAVGPGFVAGTVRDVPWTIIVAGQIARLESTAGHPNVDPIIKNGLTRWATSVDQYFSPDDADDLYDAGMNIVTKYQTVPQTYTFHTMDSPTSEWVELAHTRLDRYIQTQAFEIGRQMQGELLPADWSTIQNFGSRLRDMLEGLRGVGALFGTSPGEAYLVDVTSVNDTETIAAREVNADMGVKMTPHAEQVNIQIAKIPLASALAA
jgi:hypothetical protein